MRSLASCRLLSCSTQPLGLATTRPPHGLPKPGETTHTPLAQIFVRERHQYHIPNTSPDDQVYILTVLTSKCHHDAMTELRRAYFPKAAYKVPAHITLFHGLPSSKLAHIKADIAAVASATRTFGITATAPFRMAKGVGIHVTGLGPVASIFEDLQAKWKDVLSQQDRRKFRGHYTVMNKVDDGELVDKSLEDIKHGFEPNCGSALGLSLWRYDKGWWRHEEDYRFRLSETG